MQNKKLRVILAVASALLIALVAAVSVSAEISVKDGAITGLDKNASYEYASVTVVNYESPSYTIVPEGSTTINGLTPGVYVVNNRTTGTKKAVWIPGDKDDRTDIGEVYYNATHGKDVVRTQATTNWVEGVWTGTSAVNHSTFATYYISAHSHIASSVASGLVAGTTSQTKVRSEMQNIFFRYAYAPEEILPVDDLYTLGFLVGVRQGAFSISYSETASDPNPKTVYNLYTIDENGVVSVHTTTKNIKYATSTSHSIAVSSDFPNATGWVLGIEIYPYGEIPRTGLKISASKNPAGTGYTNTCFFVQYIPNLYTTKDKSSYIAIPFQYNGANHSYIKGYGDGTFNPDGNITKAELSTILARLVIGSDTIPVGGNTKFVDYSPNDWYYNAVNFLEHQKIFDYIEGNKINAEKPLTRGELAQIIYGFVDLDAVNKASFDDITESTPYADAILMLADYGVLGGYPDGTFRPDAFITRAETLTIINRIINVATDSASIGNVEFKNNFNDIEGHWAKNDILMAANDNVKSERHKNADASSLLETDTTIQLETNHIKLVIEKKSGKVTSLINKYDNTNILASTSTPWISYVVATSGFTFTPKQVNVVDGRLHFVYTNGVEAYFIVDVKDNYFTLELDSNLPLTIKTIYFGNLNVNTPFSNDLDSYRLSGISMHMNTNMQIRPGGSYKYTSAYAMRKFGTMGAKFGITFSRFGGSKNGEHRQYLKEILDAIDPTVGITSTKGSAYTYDNTDVFGDYVIQSSGLTAATATETAQTLKKYSIDQLDFHQGGSSFIQGDFNFVCAKEGDETFTTAAQFKERVGNLVTAEGIQLGLHTYTSLISSSSTNILTNPKWQKQIAHKESENLTLKEDVAADATAFLTNEDASSIKIVGNNTSGGTSSLPWAGPNTGYFLIDEEIVLVTANDATGLTTVSRGKCGTKATEHKAGAKIIHYLGHYGMFQPIPGSELFYHIADLTAQAYNDGGFEMIYLDGFESMTNSNWSESDSNWYWQASFIQRIVSQCKVSPIIEGSDFPVSFWNARARGGAVDHGVRETKKYNYNHMTSNRNFLNSFITATLGWFHYSPDITAGQKNTFSKTMFIDDLDYLGAMGVAFDMSSVANGFSVSTYNTYKTISNNTLYYSLYSRLRKGGYFSDEVKTKLQEGILEGKEYKIEEQADGSWAFREMKYFKNKVFDLSDSTYATGKGTNPYDAQTPYIRIEQRFSTLSKNQTAVVAFDETAAISTLTGKHSFTQIDLDTKRAFKVKVYGNGNPDDAILLTFGSAATTETGRLDFFIPVAHTGWREFILIDMDNADYDGYDFAGDYITSCHYATFRNGYSYKTANSVTINLCGSCEGVMIDDIAAYTLTNSPAKNPSVTINGQTITFSATVRSGEYIEYFPTLGKAYHHSYDYKTLSPTNNGNTATVKEISFSGSVTVPEGDFTYSYNATKATSSFVESLGSAGGPLRAKVVIGLQSSELIENEDTWVAPEIPLEDNLQYITLT